MFKNNTQLVSYFIIITDLEMTDYWFASYHEQCEYQDICIRIERLTFDLRENFNGITQNRIQKIVHELDDLKERKQGMQSHGVRVVNTTPFGLMNIRN